ncbi:prevent-host-death protein [Chryseobacterium caseinilyticum]|uniref:Prevent-host-death protein n=1 Tax=Chryseobacterium caseinilyticum TaxID=2771428 RepID=A0ABR8Z8C8_9FLAO|nr:prevent-host-death protein [Chryseobacterium caseinilyticum]MBD8081471.1 prevent-host-death protein [Chryseobacterium caseinilyticum]
MEYIIELDTQEAASHIAFHNLIFKPFKINIIERHQEAKGTRGKILEVIFKIRTLNDKLIKCKNGNGRVILSDHQLISYRNFHKVLHSYEYRRNLLDRKALELKFVDFFLMLAISNYDL